MQANEKAEAMRVEPLSASPTIASASRPAKCQGNETKRRDVTSRAPSPELGRSLRHDGSKWQAVLDFQNVDDAVANDVEDAKSSTTCFFNAKSVALSSGRGPFSPPNLYSRVTVGRGSRIGWPLRIRSSSIRPKLMRCINSNRLARQRDRPCFENCGVFLRPPPGGGAEQTTIDFSSCFRDANTASSMRGVWALWPVQSVLTSHDQSFSRSARRQCSRAQ